MRLFIAIELSEELRASLAAFQASLKGLVNLPVSWTDPRGTHLTLNFLGEAPEEGVPAISAALRRAAAACGPFTIILGELGAFPSLSRPRVYWAGVGGDTAALGRLKEAVEHEIAQLGYPTEERGFHPHLTLGRVREERGSRRGQSGAAPPKPAVPVRPADQQVNGMALIRSQLSPRGAVYTVLEAFPLAG